MDFLVHRADGSAYRLHPGKTRKQDAKPHYLPPTSFAGESTATEHTGTTSSSASAFSWSEARLIPQSDRIGRGQAYQRLHELREENLPSCIALAGFLDPVSGRGCGGESGRGCESYVGIRSEEGRMDSSADLVAGRGQADTVRDVPAAMREAVHLLAAPGSPHPRDLPWAVQRWIFLVRRLLGWRAPLRRGQGRRVRQGLGSDA